MRGRGYAKVALTAVVLSLAAPAHGQDATDPSRQLNPLLTRPSLLDGQGSPKEALRKHGINADLWWTQFNQRLLEGDGNTDWQYGGKLDLLLNIDAHKLGLWRGFSINFHQEWEYGEDANTQGDGTLLPVNTALGFPRLGGYDHDTSIVFNQKLSDRLSIGFGKYNMLDAASRTPLLGGGGINTFMNLGLAAPISGITPPYIFAGSASLRTKRVNYNLMVYDPNNAQDWSVLGDLFEEGVNTSLSASLPVTIRGRRGTHSVRGVYSTEEGVDLRDVPQLQLPPELRVAPRTQAEPWYLSYSFQQYLQHNADDPSKGWGVFGQFAIASGNPNPFDGHWFLGVGGNSPLPGRSDDLWGVAYFEYKLDSGLRRAAIQDFGIGLGSESGVEIYYNVAVTPWLRITGDLQFINPFPTVNDKAVFGAIRTQFKF